MTEEELQNLIGSNAKAIAALASLVSDTNKRVDTVADTVNTLARQMIEMNRQISSIEHEIRDLRADTRELQIENNRILRFLEQRGN